MPVDVACAMLLDLVKYRLFAFLLKINWLILGLITQPLVCLLDCGPFSLNCSIGSSPGSFRVIAKPIDHSAVHFLVSFGLDVDFCMANSVQQCRRTIEMPSHTILLLILH